VKSKWLTLLQQDRECLISDLRLLPVWWDSRQCSPSRTIVLAKASGAKFSKLFRKIFGRLLFQRKYADFRNFFGTS